MLFAMLNFHMVLLLLQIWPPKSVKDSGSRLHSLLKEAIMQVRILSGTDLVVNNCSIYDKLAAVM